MFGLWTWLGASHTGEMFKLNTKLFELGKDIVDTNRYTRRMWSPRYIDLPFKVKPSILRIPPRYAGIKWNLAQIGARLGVLSGSPERQLSMQMVLPLVKNHLTTPHRIDTLVINLMRSKKWQIGRIIRHNTLRKVMRFFQGLSTKIFRNAIRHHLY